MVLTEKNCSSLMSTGQVLNMLDALEKVTKKRRADDNTMHKEHGVWVGRTGARRNSEIKFHQSGQIACKGQEYLI